MEKKAVFVSLSIILIAIVAVVSGVFLFFKKSETGYHIEKNKVFYKVYGISTTEIAGVDAGSFRVLPFGDGFFGEDKNHIYFKHLRLPDSVDKNSFKMLTPNGNSFYTRDKHHVYYCNNLLDQADPDTFTLLTDGFAHDSKNAYYQETRLDGIDVSTFKILDNLYATDGKIVFYTKNLVKGADAASFKVHLDEDYAQDKYKKYRFEVPGQIINDEFVAD